MANTNLETMTVGSDVFATFHNAACSTAAATAAKTATAENTFALFAGANVRVTFANENTAENPTLNINSTGAAPIMVDTATAAGNGTWSAGAVLDLRYNGTSWLIVSAGAHDEEKANQAQISGIFSASATYAVGAYVVQNGLLYRCTTAHSGAWNAAHFEQVTIGGELSAKVPVYGNGVNLLDNWYFIGGGRFPINQRGQAIYSTAGYAIDRWILASSTTLVVNSDSVDISIAASSVANVARAYQLSDKQLPSTGIVTLSFLVKSVVGNVSARIRFTDASNTYAGQITLDALQAGLNSVSGNIPSGAVYASPEIRNADTSACSVSLIAAKLELGDTQTLAHQDANGNWILNDPPPNFQQELAKCQRYQVSIPIYSRYPIAYSPSENAFDFVIPVPVTMRALPSIEYGAFEIRQNSSTASDFTFSCVLNQNGSILIRAEKANHGLTGFVTLYCVNNAMLSANL